MNQHSEREPTGPVEAPATKERPNFHAIVGPNGMCECGVRADGTVVTCADLLELYVAQRIAENSAR